MTGLASSLGLSAAWLTKVLLLSLRIGAVFMMTPLLAPASVPSIVRLLFILGLAAALSQALPAIALAEPELHGSVMLILAALTELALGATLAVGILVAFSAFAVAGRLLDIQIGFGIGQVLDPASNTQAPILTTSFNQIALLVFFLVNGHHALLRGLAYSLERFPLGRAWPLDAALVPLIRQMAGLFSLAFSLAAPVVFCLLLVEMALGVLARNLPQMNMLALGIPVKIVVGMLALSVWFAGIGDAMSRIYGSIYQTWDAIFVFQAGAQ